MSQATLEATSPATLIEPDVEFKRQIAAMGGETLANCYQCGTCTVVCPISPDWAPFPRKEILWSQWGLKDRLLKDPDIWLCHQCNDCSARCPRGAHPGDVLAVLRQKAIERYAVPGFLAQMVASPKALPALLLIPAVLMLAAIWLTGGFTGVREAAAEGSPVDFDHFFSHYPVIIFFVFFTGLAALSAAAGLLRFWNDLKANPIGGAGEAVASGAEAAVSSVTAILSHGKFRECETYGKRYRAHLMLMYGFLGMFVTTALAAVIYYVPEQWGALWRYPFALWHPVKVLGNVSGLVFLAGLFLVVADRRSSRKERPQSTYGDWLFLWIIGLTVATGIVCQAARMANEPVSAYSLYFIHLVLVFFLLVYLPYSKFAHLLYRTVAMTYAAWSGRETETPPVPDVSAGQTQETGAEKLPEQPAA